MKSCSWPLAFRRQQSEALDAIDARWAAGSNRAWVVLPPGLGKTLTGLEAARRLGRPVVVFVPNTAIQGQWIRTVSEFVPVPMTASSDRDLADDVTVLTYQSLAHFDPDDEVDEDGRLVGRRRSRAPLLQQLSPSGRGLVERLRGAGQLTLVLDECHHLLEVWGRLVAELLELLDQPYVVALTATPPAALTQDQADLVQTIFGEVVYSASIPAAVRDGYLAPFAELAWLTTPTPSERDWLSSEAVRFAELTTDLVDPTFGSRPFLPWLDQRLVERGSAYGQLGWSQLERDHPQLTEAALRLHHIGLLALPDGARMREEHRRAPDAEDWVALIGDWARHHLATSQDPADVAARKRLTDALPSIGYGLTRGGHVRRAQSPVNRVLSRSAGKTHACVEILRAETGNLGAHLRALVLCDHEKAAATLPARLAGVLDAEAGSARLVLRTLLDDPQTAALDPMLVTGSTVACGLETAVRFHAWASTGEVVLDALAAPEPDGVVHITGRWSSRTWVPKVTEFLELGSTKVLIGTRALLGEGWDARSLNTLIDLTTATTSTAVVQTRGRTLRVDPAQPDKVAHTWTVVTVSEEHPEGDTDYLRFVRKHAAYFGVTQTGEVVDGVGHVSPELSPYDPPSVVGFDAFNAVQLVRSADRTETRRLWSVGSAYRDERVHTVTVRPSIQRTRLPALPMAMGGPAQPSLVLGPRGPVRGARGQSALAALSVTGVVAAALASVVGVVAGPWLALVTGVAIAAVGGGSWALRAGALLAAATFPPSLERYASAVAEAMRQSGLSPVGPECVRSVVTEDGSYRFALSGVTEDVSAQFADALDEVLSPIGTSRYVIARYGLSPADGSLPARVTLAVRQGTGRLRPTTVTFHAVPAVFARGAARARAFATAWSRWISAAELVRTDSPEGVGIVAAHRGSSPTDVTTAMRTAWE